MTVASSYSLEQILDTGAGLMVLFDTLLGKVLLVVPPLPPLLLLLLLLLPVVLLFFRETKRTLGSSFARIDFHNFLASLLLLLLLLLYTIIIFLNTIYVYI